MQKYIIANWKSNKSLAEVESWANTVEISAVIHQVTNLKVVLCPPAIYLPFLSEKLPKLTLGVQTVSSYPNGAYTGALSAQQLSQWAKYALLGHTERRKYFGETSAMVAQQVRQALDAKMTPIVAVDDQNWMSQLALFEKSELAASLIMYEPPTAISSAAGAQAADIDQVLVAIQSISAEFETKGLLYGGSVSADNVATYLSETTISGVVPGAASLESESFIRLLAQATNAVGE